MASAVYEDFDLPEVTRGRATIETAVSGDAWIRWSDGVFLRTKRIKKVLVDFLTSEAFLTFVCLDSTQVVVPLTLERARKFVAWGNQNKLTVEPVPFVPRIKIKEIALVAKKADGYILPADPCSICYGTGFYKGFGKPCPRGCK